MKTPLILAAAFAATVAAHASSTLKVDLSDGNATKTYTVRVDANAPVSSVRDVTSKSYTVEQDVKGKDGKTKDVKASIPTWFGVVISATPMKDGTVYVHVLYRKLLSETKSKDGKTTVPVAKDFVVDGRVPKGTSKLGALGEYIDVRATLIDAPPPGAPDAKPALAKTVPATTTKK